jgi:hypothetical protein
MAAGIQRMAARPAGVFGKRQGIDILPDGALRQPPAGSAGDERFGCAVARPSCQDAPVSVASAGGRLGNGMR